MNIKKRKIFGRCILLLLVVIVLASCGGKSMQSQNVQLQSAPPDKKPLSFSEIVASGNLEDLSLTIYYIADPLVFFRLPLSVDLLINNSSTKKIVVDSNHLEEHIDLLVQLSNATFIAVEQESFLDARLCYIFETKQGGRVFEVAMDGVQFDENGEYIGSCIYVNGLAVYDDDIFYDVLKPFLTEDAAKELRSYFIGR